MRRYTSAWVERRRSLALAVPVTQRSARQMQDIRRPGAATWGRGKLGRASWRMLRAGTLAALQW